MMRDLHLSFRLDFSSPEDQADSEDVIIRLLGLNARLNMIQLRNNPLLPMLYESGVVYTPPDQADGRPSLKRGDLKELLALLRKMGADPDTALMVVRMLKGIEIFMDVTTLYRRGKGDCNELVPVRIAELWRAGVPATPWLQFEGVNKNGGKAYHVVVRHPDGSAEDVSAILGMGGPAFADFRREECRKNAERYYIAASQGLPAEEMGLVPRDGVFRLRRDGGGGNNQPKVIDASEWAQVSGRRLLRAA